jgi:hypothetical protein
MARVPELDEQLLIECHSSAPRRAAMDTLQFTPLPLGIRAVWAHPKCDLGHKGGQLPQQLRAVSLTDAVEKLSDKMIVARRLSI